MRRAVLSLRADTSIRPYAMGCAIVCDATGGAFQRGRMMAIHVFIEDPVTCQIGARMLVSAPIQPAPI